MSSLTRDLMGVTGAACLAVGLWLVWPPLAFIVLGLLLLGGAIAWSAAVTPPGGAPDARSDSPTIQDERPQPL